MLLAVGVISGGVFMLSPGHWEQVQSLLPPRGHQAKVLYLLQHRECSGSGRREGTPVFLAGFCGALSELRARGSSVCSLFASQPEQNPTRVHWQAEKQPHGIIPCETCPWSSDLSVCKLMAVFFLFSRLWSI